MRHQIIALAMMLEKESGYVEEPMFPSLWRKEVANDNKTVCYRHAITRQLEPRPIPVMGGILADDMGLGKTLSVLALICSSLDLDSQEAKNQNRKREHHGTLIVAPKSTIHGWMAQASEHIHKGQIRIEIYHGPQRQNLANQFRHIDVVITTYETLRSEWETPAGTGPLFAWKWLRVILDEAHHIRNRSRNAFQSVCSLVARYRWCLTGTPIHNSLDDYGALLSFIRVFPFVQKSKFMSSIVQLVEEKHELGIERLQRLIRVTCLRRTKQKTLTLPHRLERVHEIYLHQEDQVLYDIYKKRCAEKAAGVGKRRGESASLKGENNILSLITYLRYICDHGEQLLPDTVKYKRAGSPRDCYRPSAKVLALLENLKQERIEGNTKQRKSVIFSSWVKMLDLVQQALHQEQICFQRIDGRTSLEGRRRALQEFNVNPDYTVMLATIGSSAEGINLIAASTVHLLEPHWNPMVEAQAVDRVHRIGQTQEVKVIRYIVPNSVEAYVQQVQEEKMGIINQTMSMNGVTEADIESRRWERMKEMLE
ncbi:SNF2 family N-terminal domain-containing protein [Hypomontagnella submonticulosa]|nr:SNF2 family N-terminal domain-containing protein [Hypomontagnella submonticulosa]